ncbi:MAG TPA: RpiB/LacA/LacB family sugar-phosphate isomerase [Candidatus Saccharimonadales bacterium]|jgi:ribose 5-phosphate isomerase B
MKIALTTDHTGFEKLQQLQEFLSGLGHETVSYGPHEFDPADDYPDFMFPAARAVAEGTCECAIIIGGSGQGEAMCANRVKGVRCALYYGPTKAIEAIDAEGRSAQDKFEILRLSRQHNHANVLSLAARFLSQIDIEQAVRIWLEAPFSNAERHERRVKKIDELS